MGAALKDGARVLLIRLSALGDVLFALETLASLKQERPDVHVDFLVEDRFATLLREHPQIENLIVYPRRRTLAIPGHLLGLMRTRYDAVLDLHGILKSSMHVFFLRARRKLGYAAPGAREGAEWLYREKVTLPDPLPHRAERGYYLLRALGLEGARTRPVLPTSAKVADCWPATSGPRVVLHPGVSAFADFKRWPEANYKELGRRLTERGIQVAVSFGPGERDLAERVRSDGLTTIDGGDLGLIGLATTFRGADLVVAGDTGPLHIAAASGTRVVALFGPKDPALYGPRGERGHTVLFHDVPCRPCTLRRCPSPQCVLGISVDRAEQAVIASLDGAPS